MGEAVTQEGGAGGRETWQEAGPGSSSGRRALGSLSLCSLQGGGGSQVLETAPLRTLLPFPRAVVDGGGTMEGAQPGPGGHPLLPEHHPGPAKDRNPSLVSLCPRFQCGCRGSDSS